MTYWTRSNRFDPRAVRLADEHYNRRKVGSPQFVPPGRNLVLLTEDADAVWVTSWPFAQYVRHAWPGAWVCSLFRREPSAPLASDLIESAVAVTRYVFGEPPDEGFITFVNADKVRRKRDPGRCYRRAGWVPAGYTAGGLVALHLPVDAMPEPVPPIGSQMALGEMA